MVPPHPTVLSKDIINLRVNLHPEFL